MKFGLIAIMACYLSTVYTEAFSFAGAGGGHKQQSCRAATLSKAAPEKLSVIQQGETFSFELSGATRDRISVEIKEQMVDLTITELGPNRFQVTGNVPDSVPNGYAKIQVSSTTPNNCPSIDGWLVIVGSGDVQCATSKVKNINPGKLSSIRPGEKFTFEISDAQQSTIRLSVKKVAIDISLKKLARNRFNVTGTLTNNFPLGFAKVSVQSSSAPGCPQDAVNWLYKVVN